MKFYEVVITHVVEADSLQEAQQKAEKGESTDKYVSAVLTLPQGYKPKSS